MPAMAGMRCPRATRSLAAPPFALAALGSLWMAAAQQQQTLDDAQATAQNLMDQIKSQVPAEQINPNVFEMSETTRGVMFDDNVGMKTPSLVLFRDKKQKASRRAEKQFRSAFPQVRADVLAVVSGVDSEVERKLLNTMRFPSGDPVPMMGIVTFGFSEDGGAVFTSWRYEGEIKKDTVEAFVKQFLAGELEPYVASEPVPRASEEFDGKVRKLVGRTYAAGVADEEKDRVVLFYTSPSDVCENFKQIFKDAAQSLAHVETLEFMWVDASRNEVPQPQRFPETVLLPAGPGKHGEAAFLRGVVLNGHLYQGSINKGEQSTEALIKWLRKTVTQKFKGGLQVEDDDEEEESRIKPKRRRQRRPKGTTEL